MNIEKILNKYIEPKRIGNEKYMVLNTNIKTLQEELEKQLSIHGVMRSFLCRHNVPGFYIKEGKIYKPLGVTENHITITNDLGYTETYHKDWFIEIK